MSLTVRLIIIVTIIVTIVDFVGYLAVKRRPEMLSARFVIMMIIGTVIPIAINIWWRLRKSGL
jgi:hypothetical protein